MKHYGGEKMNVVLKKREIDLNQAVYLSESRDLFMKIVSSMRKDKKRYILDYLKVNLKSVEPVYFNMIQFNKKKHDGCVFLFIDKDFKIVGTLVGSLDWDYSCRNFEDYHASASNSKYSVKKNRKNMTLLSHHILMFTPEMRKFRVKNFSQRVQNIRERLFEYKIKKYEQVDLEQLRQITLICINKVTRILLDSKNEEKIDKIKKRFSFNKSTLENLLSFLTSNLSSYEEMQKYDSQSRYYSYSNEFKIKIIDFYNFLRKL
jgi:hypothetical protein